MAGIRERFEAAAAASVKHAGPRTRGACRRTRERLWPLVECELPERERAEVEAHLAICPTCAATYAATRRARDSLAPGRRREVAEETELTAALAAVVSARLAQPDAARRHAARRLAIPVGRRGIAVALAACVLAAVVAILFGRLREGPVPAESVPGGAWPRTAQATPDIRESPPPVRTLGPRHASDHVSPTADAAGGRLHATARLRRAAEHGRREARRTRRWRRTPRGTTSDRHRRPRLAQLVANETPPSEIRYPKSEIRNPVMVVRKMAPGTPSFAYARGVIPTVDGDDGTIVEITREQKREEETVCVTLVMTAATPAESEQEEILP